MTRQEYMDMYDVVGVAMEVHKTLGRGMAEQVYQEAFVLEMKLRGMMVEREKELRLHYKGTLMEKSYYADFFYKNIIIEFKSVEEITSDHRAQLMNYMRIAQQERGILFNFGERRLYAERYLYLPNEDDFILLNQDNYKWYITD
ncbi:MAG: GxxExxY protein [Bacteroidaceae bacterium]|nr:GxxExxY protein [Bacteroidaceae bacterium]MBQ8453807.1 GxxExxY protein [Bacteroidaceae bacterium]MBQ9171263.1 GxxExxY protein [Bacteroidaceae bacterium]